MVPDVIAIVLKDFPLEAVIKYRRTSKSFKIGISTLLNERLQQLSLSDFDCIKSYLNANERRYGKISQIAHERLKVTVAKVGLSSNYVLWNPKALRDVHFVENNVKNFDEFIKARCQFFWYVWRFMDDASLYGALNSEMKQRTIAVHQALQLEDDFWVQNRHINFISDITHTWASTPPPNHLFYAAAWSLEHERCTDRVIENEITQRAFETLTKLVEQKHTLAMWFVGQYCINALNPQYGMSLLREVAEGDDPVYAYRFAKICSITADRSRDERAIEFFRKAMNANYLAAFYEAGQYEMRFHNEAEACLYFEKGAAFGCQKCQQALVELF